jgi:hypothetical protein
VRTRRSGGDHVARHDPGGVAEGHRGLARLPDPRDSGGVGLCARRSVAARCSFRIFATCRR